MIAVLVGLLANTFIGIFGTHARDCILGKQRTCFTHTVTVVLAAITVGFAFLFEIGTIALATQHQRPLPSWLASLPITPLDDRAPLYGHAPIGPAIAACTFIETLALGVIAYVGRRTSFSRTAGTCIGLVSFCMVFLAFICPATTSFDMYAYDGSAHVAMPYRTSPHAFEGELSVLNRIYGVPLAPSPYGPAWIAMSKIATAHTHTLRSQLLALRALGILAFVACLLALRTMQASPVSLAVVAINPALLVYYVLDAHNDLVAIALVLWAIALTHRSRNAAIALGILAGAVKLPFLAIGMLAVVRILPVRERVASALALSIGAILLYAAFGGGDFIQAIGAVSRLYHAALTDPLSNFLHAALGLAAIASLLVCLFADRYVPTAAWSFAALGAAFFGWYVPWGMPYALLEGRWFVPFMISLPGLSFILATTYSPTILQPYLMAAILALTPLTTYFVLRERNRNLATRIA